MSRADELQTLPLYLRQDMVTEPEAVSLQLYLLTQEVAMQRRQMVALAAQLRALADTLTLPAGDLTG